MENYILDFAISTVITWIRSMVTAESKNKYKKVALKIFKEIAKQFGDDEEFRKVIK